MATQNPNILFQVIDDSTFNVEGELDVYNPEKFPLALTFSIKDVMDMTSTKGSFSKSFKIPATSNNNEVLKFLISDSFYNSFEYIEGKKARIFIDGQLILEGSFQIKGHGVLRTPEYYECLVFGDNYKWVNAIDKLNLCDIDFDAGNYYPNTPSLIGFGRQNIMDTWEYDMAAQEIGGVGTHVVYPLVNTGKWTYGNFAHPDDMAPAIWIYDMVKVILAAQGYTLNSSFMNTDWFKKLISITPRQSWENSADILVDYQFEYEQESGWTDWKTPWDFREEWEVGDSDFFGAWQNMDLVTPTSDPNSLWTVQTWTDNWIDVTNLSKMVSISGWYWGSYGYMAAPVADNNLTGFQGNFNPPATNWFDDLCPASWNALINHGWNWNCVWEGAAPLGGVSGPIAAPTGGYDLPWKDAMKFQTSFFGTYEFNGKCEVEMDNDAVLNKDNESYDPMLHYYSGNKGFSYDGCGGQIASNPPEYRWQWWTYRASLFVMHYEESVGKVNVIYVDDDEKKGYCSSTVGSELPTSATGNLTFNLGFSGLEIDILHANDYVFYYVEVTEEMWVDEIDGWGSGSTGIERCCQCKYRMRGGKINGGITESIIDGGSVSLQNLLPCDVTQLEWLNGLTGLFNLYWHADEMTKTIYVEPRDNFFEGADSAVDWSDKLDWGEKQTAKYVYDSLKRNICFTYQNDSADGFVEERNRRKGQICELGSHVMDLGELFVNEDEQIGSNYYGPTYMNRDKVIATNNNNAPNIPFIHSEYTQIWSTTNNNNYPDKVDEHLARILLWGGLTPLNLADGITNANKWRWGYIDPTLTPEKLKTYPFAGVYCDEDPQYFGPVTVGSITYYPQLYFQDVDANMVQPAPATWTMISGLYDVFWERNIENLLTRPKIKTAMFHLTAQDISQLKFQKLIYIENSESSTYWIINKVVDYKPAMNQMTKVELFEWTLAKPRKKSSPRLGQEYGPDKDSGIGQVGSNKRRLEINFASQLGITNVGRFQSDKTPNLALNSPVLPISEEAINNKAASTDNPRWNIQSTTGATTTQRQSNNSFNIGNNNQVKQGSNSITIGQNNQSIGQQGIVIGNNKSSWTTTPSPIEFHTGQSNPALVITSTGEVLEGGGGPVIFEDASGNFVEVFTEVETIGGVKNYKKVLISRKI